MPEVSHSLTQNSKTENGSNSAIKHRRMIFIVSVLLFLSSTAQGNWFRPIHFKTNRPAKPRWSLSKVISSPELLAGGWPGWPRSLLNTFGDSKWWESFFPPGE